MSQRESLPGIGDVVADKYRIESLLGQGGMGAVYLAQHLVTDKRVALKWLLPRAETAPDEIERFIREARAAARIEHPNIVDIYDVGEHAGSFFLVMEYLKGRAFAEAVKVAPLPPGETLRSLLPAMRGVHAAHRRGVVHRDLKPDNIFLCFDEDGEPLDTKVLDFGISKVREHHTETGPSLTSTGMVMGTPHYIAPEQAEDAKSVDGRADVYAMGVILYQALGGEVPFDAESLTALLLKITRGEPRHLAELNTELPASLCDVVMKAMARPPEDRYPDMAALMEALGPFIGNQSLPAGTIPSAASVDASSATPLASPSDVARAEREAAGAPRGWLIGVAALVLVAVVLWLALALGEPAAEHPVTPAAVAVPEPAPAPQPAPQPVAEPELEPEPETESTAEPAKKPKARKKRRRQTPEAEATPAPPVPPTPTAQRKPEPSPQAPAEPDSKTTSKGRLGIEMNREQF